MGQIQLTISLILIGLFTIAIIGFAINFAIDNSAPISLSDDPELSGLYTDSNQNLSDFNDKTGDQYSSIINTTINPGSDVPQSAAPFAITPLSAIGVVVNIMQVAYTKIFGTGSGFGIFVTALIAVIVFMIGLYVYKTLRGLPD